MKRAALYARVSTNKHRCRSCRATFKEKTESETPVCPKCGSADIERSQTPETQLLPLRRYAEQRGIEAVEYIDRESSGKARPRLDAMLKDARQRRFNVVVVVRYDRFARSTKELILALEEFHALDIDFVSLNEAIDTSTPSGKLFFTMVSGFAEFEHSIIRERVLAGVDRAREQGKRLGRPTVIIDREKVQRAAADGQSISAIARQHGIARSTVRDILGWKRVAKIPLKRAPLSR